MVARIDGWEVARTDPDAAAGPGELGALQWRPVVVPGTVAGALGDEAGGLGLDAFDWWFRASFEASPPEAGEEVVLRFGGLATVSEAFLNGARVLESESMFEAHQVDVGELLSPDGNELLICCRALARRLAVRRRPRARWRTRLVDDGNLRWYRTMLIGRAPGFAPGPPVVGPWRPVQLERRRGVTLEGLRLRASLAGSDGRLEVAARARGIGGADPPGRLWVRVGSERAELTAGRCVVAVPQPEPWWPHTHGQPALHEVELGAGEQVLARRKVGFRRLSAAGELEEDGLDLCVNEVPVFCRGAVWAPLGLPFPHAEEDRLRPVLDRVVEAGMNMLRVPGTGAYESDVFYDLCDELGILVWQDFMFANLDYPESDPGFMAAVEREARGVLERLGGRPSLAVLCGGSEVAQQVAMLGLDPELASGPLYGELLPRLVGEAEVEAPYVPSAPWGGDLPFRPDRGVANYYGVGAYLRPLEDARLSRVRFAAECLAFANVPDDESPPAPGGAAWKAGVPRDVGAGWDFDDVRDHYLGRLFGVDPVQLRAVDPEAYLELARAISGEVMAETLGEWRRAGSPCHGALLLWLKDLYPGAGWGLLDHGGRPKAAWWHVRRALAPLAVWSTDEGLGGVIAHVANDTAEPIDATLRASLYRDGELRVAEAVEPVALGPRSSLERNVEAMLGRFVDAAWAYRFGPPGHDAIVLSLESGTDLLAQAFRFPVGYPLRRQSADELGLECLLGHGPAGWHVCISARRLVWGVRLSAPGFEVSDDCFSLEPGGGRQIQLLGEGSPTVTVTALNLSGSLRVAPGG